MSNMASRLWSRALTLGRDSFSLSSAIAQEVRQSKNSNIGDAVRNVLVSQTRQSNQAANSMLSLQQQVGLIRYHGLMGYWRNHRPAILAGGVPSFSSDATTTTATSTPGTNQSGSVAQVAFMITASMRKELSEQFGYTADQIKALTPVEASLVLHHKLKPEDKEKDLPGLLAAHKEAQDKSQREQAELEEKKRLEEEKEARLRPKVMAEAQGLKQEESNNESETSQAKPLVLSTSVDKSSQGVGTEQESKVIPTQQSEPIEGLKSASPPDFPKFDPQNPQRDVSGAQIDTPLGSFVESMEEKVDVEKEWFEVIETRADDNSLTPVALYSTKVEAETVAALKSTFAQRRAKEDKDNPENVAATTYSIQKTLK